MSRDDAALQVELYQTSPIPLDVQFSCPAGKILALVGPSGSGKSTILRSIAGIYTPASGKIRCGGEEWLDTERGIRVETRRRSTGFVFQSYALFPHLSAIQNVMESLNHLPRAERSERARGFLARTHLQGLEDRRPDELSGGQQQRVAVARALARDPKVLLLDEPFSAVDQVTRDKLYEDLAAERAELQMPVILVTHALDEAARLADIMCVLYKGRTLQIGTPYDVMTKPGSQHVANVLGLGNTFPAKVAAHDTTKGRTRLHWGKAVLETRIAAAFPVGAEICWFAPQTHIVLHRKDQSQPREEENRIDGIVARCVALREMTTVQLAASAMPDAVLSFSIPTRIARSNALEAGMPISVSILADGIHVMPQMEVA